MRFIGVLILLGVLYGCGSGGFVPGGPHTLGQVYLANLILTNAKTTGLSPRLVGAMIAVESHGDPSAISRAGAQGLMQLMPDTATTYGAFNAFDPQENVSAGCRYMRDLLKRYHNDMSLALAAYNAGPGAVDATHKVPAYPETQAYVARVSAALHAPTN